jgi:hypothetical protein
MMVVFSKSPRAKNYIKPIDTWHPCLTIKSLNQQTDK